MESCEDVSLRKWAFEAARRQYSGHIREAQKIEAYVGHNDYDGVRRWAVDNSCSLEDAKRLERWVRSGVDR